MARRRKRYRRNPSAAGWLTITVVVGLGGVAWVSGAQRRARAFNNARHFMIEAGLDDRLIEARRGVTDQMQADIAALFGGTSATAIAPPPENGG